MLTAKDIKKFIAEVPDDTYVTIRDGYITCVFHDHVVSLNRVGAKWTENVAIIEEECVNKPKDVGLTIDEAGPTLGNTIEEINSKFVRSFAEIGIDTEGKDLLEIIAEMANTINRLQIELDRVKRELRMEMLFG